MKVLIWYLNKNFKIREFFMKFFDFFCNHFIFVVLLSLTKKGLFYMRRHKLKLFLIAFSLIGGFSIIVFNKGLLNQEMRAASNYSAGNHVYVGNESFTVIDPNTMTLLADQATADGEMTWDHAVDSLNNLSSDYGEIGSKIVDGKFSLPKTSDLISVTNGDQTALTTISPIASDWWLGDESVDNRSRFVGANTNSLVTDVSIMKNVVDETNYVCLNDQTVIEKGIKPTKSEADKVTTDTFQLSSPILEIDSEFFGGMNYGTKNCESGYGGGGSVDGMKNQRMNVFLDTAPLLKDETLQASDLLAYDNYGTNIYLNKVLVDFGMDSYIREYLENPSSGYDKTFTLSVSKNTCYNLQDSYIDKAGAHGAKSFKVHTFPSTGSIWVKIVNVSNSKTVTCGGHAQTAGESFVRPLLTIDPSRIAYSNNSKPAFNVSSTLHQSVPVVNGDSSYLALTDPDLTIALDSNDPYVSGDILKVDRSKIDSTVSIPITVGGNLSSADRYVSAVAKTNNGESYGVLDVINGTSAHVDLDISNIPNWQTVGSIQVTLYQEVDEGTNTTYRGEGKEITLKFSSPITAITFSPNYDSGKASWNRGDTGIAGSGAKTGSFTFTGGTSGENDPTTNKDYKTWQIVDASGDPITDANFRITNNELIAKKRIEVGTYTLNIKVTDNNDESYMDTITIEVDKEKNPYDWNTSVKNKASMYYGDTLTLGVIGVRDNATVTYGPSTHVSGNIFTAKEPQKGFEITASTPATTSYGATTIKHTIDIEKRPITVQVQLEDKSGSWNNSLTINEGDALPNHEVVLDTNDTNSKGLVNGDKLTDSIFGSVQYEYRKGNEVITDPNKTAGTYQLYAIYTESDYYNVTVKAATLTVKKKSNAISLNVKGYINNNNAKPYDETKWTNQPITLKLSASDQSKLTNQQISSDATSYTSMPNGVYTLQNTKSINDETYYFKATTTDGDEITTSIQIKMDVDAPDEPMITYKEENDGMMRSLFRAITFNQMFNEEQRATFTSNDDLSGLDYFTYAITEKDNEGNTIGSTKKGKGNSYLLDKSKNYEIKVTAYDKAGNPSQTVTEVVQVDMEPPMIHGVKDKNEYKYYYLPRIVSIEDKLSGVDDAYYMKDNDGMSVTIHPEVKIKETGEYEIYAIDNAGNDITITFKIVPLPDIEDIDGSDESKDIIDQVKDELEEIKNKIDKTEKDEYEQWIKDALEKWESMRKKVVETDDKSAKVEGQGDTSFDPKTQLIVESISQSTLPKLPQNALYAYDVYLIKDNVKVQADGRIKVYLPYTDKEEPILYEIKGDQVKQIACEREGDYITFITDTLNKYAISNKAQKKECQLEGTKINIDTDNDGYPDVNVDIDNDCVADLNIDMDNDQKPDINIDSNGDGKADINVDTNEDGKADINIAVIKKWIPEKVVTINGITYDTMGGIEPYLNIDDDGDGKADRNIDADGNGIIDSEEGNKNTGGAIGSANTSDNTKWNLWWILMIITSLLMVYAVHKKIKQKDTFQ